MGEPFHERRRLVEQCAQAAFEAAFGERADMKAWDRQAEAFRQSFRAEAKAVLRIAWEAAQPAKDGRA